MAADAVGTDTFAAERSVAGTEAGIAVADTSEVAAVDTSAGEGVDTLVAAEEAGTSAAAEAGGRRAADIRAVARGELRWPDRLRS